MIRIFFSSVICWLWVIYGAHIVLNVNEKCVHEHNRQKRTKNKISFFTLSLSSLAPARLAAILSLSHSLIASLRENICAKKQTRERKKKQLGNMNMSKKKKYFPTIDKE